MKSQRTAHTLGEMLIVMMLMTALLPSALQNVRRMMMASRRSSESLEMVRITRAISYQWRLDVQNATSAEIHSAPSGNARLELGTPNGERIEYELLPDELVRRVVSSEGTSREESYSRTLRPVVSQEPASRERRSIWNASWMRDGQVLQLTIDSLPREYIAATNATPTSETTSNDTKRVTQILATLGRDHRHHRISSTLVGEANR